MAASSVIDLITALWLGFVGACIGSFLNVVAYRMPRGESVIWTPSHCPKCDHAIRAYDNVPVLGWLWLKGKCRDCGQPISPRYAIVEFTMGLAFLVLAYVELFSGGANLVGGPITEFRGALGNVWVPQWKLIGAYAYHGLLLSLLMSIALMALDDQKVPRSLVVFSFALGFVCAALGVRNWIGLDGYRYLDTGKQTYGILVWIAEAIAGGLFGGLLGLIFSAIRRENFKETEVNDPAVSALAITGLFVGLPALVYLTILLFLAAMIGKLVTSRLDSHRNPLRGVIELTLFTAVFALLVCWKQLDAVLPLYGTSVPAAELQLPSQSR